MIAYVRLGPGRRWHLVRWAGSLRWLGVCNRLTRMQRTEVTAEFPEGAHEPVHYLHRAGFTIGSPPRLIPITFRWDVPEGELCCTVCVRRVLAEAEQIRQLRT